MKDILTNKVKFEETSKVTFKERCLAVLLNGIPLTKKDPGRFTIPCAIGRVGIDKALADLGASISLMPYSIEIATDEEKLLNNLDSSTTPELFSYLDLDDFKNPTLFTASMADMEKPISKLKELPSYLEYALLDAWKVADIKGISPSFCTHKILMEDNFKPVVQPQCRLNPKVQDVVKVEIVKLLDVGLIYANLDSPWISLIHVVPKKGGMTVITNDKNELVPTRTVTGWRIPLALEDQEKTTFTCPLMTSNKLLFEQLVKDREKNVFWSINEDLDEFKTIA
ncbi:hypothetical protein Tco_1355860 [Tanacetum coccineum]